MVALSHCSTDSDQQLTVSDTHDRDDEAPVGMETCPRVSRWMDHSSECTEIIHVNGLQPGWYLLSFWITDSQDSEHQQSCANHLIHKSTANCQEAAGVRGEDVSRSRFGAGGDSVSIVVRDKGVIVAAKISNKIN